MLNGSGDLVPEILYALLGYNSSILKNAADIIWDDEYNIISTEERELLIRFSSLADNYKYLNDFVMSDNSLATKHTAPCQEKEGLYFKALKNGIFLATRNYRTCITDIEKGLSTNKENRCILFEVLRKVEEHKPLLVTLKDIVDKITLSKQHGGEILNLIYDVINTKFINDRVQLSLIFKQCLQVLIMQLKTILSHGVIFDPCKEFFIEEQCYGSTKEFKRFSLIPNLMPSFISLSVANKIIRMGEVIRSLQNSYGEQCPTEYKNISHELYGQKRDQLFQDLLALENVPLFTKNEFTDVIDKFFNVVDEYLMKASFNENSFYNHMKLVRDFYLLGNGEFYRHFLSKLGSLSLRSVHSLRSVKLAFLNSAQDTKLPKSVYRAFKFSTLENQEAGDVKWTKIKLSMETKWPLQFIFTESTMKNYSKLFAFLARIKQVQTNLHNIWIETKSKDSKINEPVNHLKTRLTFLIDTLYSYLQLDVIEDEYFLFLEKLSNAQDFTTIKYTHDKFQSNIMRDSFLFIEDVYMAFNQIMDMCENYYRFMTDITAAFSPQYKQSLNELNLLFSKKPNKLSSLLNSIKDVNVFL
ncbi:gamma-tubulin complex component 4 isoform X2 [Adelges cooleyi]|uniref:gamma-tubulin complex component 4 isoform X2 n=1 Tax=Adelges cooleyi TaxID=133065 RepID=UPI00218016B3|nr:gamma-tubulin complex component 4 isoform X2 [Adelges cooleyi]